MHSRLHRNSNAKKVHGIVVCHGSVSMYQEEIFTAWKERKVPSITTLTQVKFPYSLLALSSNELHGSIN
jgi:hypothetical protein